MTGQTDPHGEAPSTDHIDPLPTWLTESLRRPARLYLRRRYRVRIHDDHYVPRTGPVLLASNHLGILDGPFLVANSPRMIHALVKREMFVGTMARTLKAVGQIPVQR